MCVHKRAVDLSHRVEDLATFAPRKGVIYSFGIHEALGRAFRRALLTALSARVYTISILKLWLKMGALELPGGEQ